MLTTPCTTSICTLSDPIFRDIAILSLYTPYRATLFPGIGFGKRGLLEKGSFQKRPFSRDSREFRDSRVSRQLPDCGKQGRIRPFSRDSRESRDFRDSRDSSSEKTPFVMTPFSGPEGKLHSTQMVLSPPWYLVSHRHTRAIADFTTYRAIVVRYPIKTSTKEFCKTMATSITRRENYRCWASKFVHGVGF